MSEEQFFPQLFIPMNKLYIARGIESCWSCDGLNNVGECTELKCPSSLCLFVSIHELIMWLNFKTVSLQMQLINSLKMNHKGKPKDWFLYEKRKEHPEKKAS